MLGVCEQNKINKHTTRNNIFILRSLGFKLSNRHPTSYIRDKQTKKKGEKKMGLTKIH